MQVMNVRNAHDALPSAIHFLLNAEDYVVREDSRNGPVYRSIEPVTTRYAYPNERVIFHPDRGENPFFHFMESLWMIAGRKDVGWISKFNKSFQQFSDNGKDFHGAYGHRWRHHFKMDQLRVIADILKADRKDRRCVLTMWDPHVDLGQIGKDFPCNTQVYFSASNDKLDMTVCCRSNDVIWGAYGANAVHFSVLQEVMAAWIGIPLGTYYQLSNNWHGYEATLEPLKSIAQKPAMNPYTAGMVAPYPIVNGPVDIWMEDLGMFMDNGPITGFRDPFFRRVVTPIFHAWNAKDNKDDPDRWDKAIDIIEQCSAPDWKLSCYNWLSVRKNAQ